MSGAAEGKAKGSGGPAPANTGVHPCPQPPSLLLSSLGVWAATGLSVGGQETRDTPGDPLLASLFSVGFEEVHLLLFPLKVTEERSYSMDSTTVYSWG